MLDSVFLKNNFKKIFKNLKNKNYFLNKFIIKNLSNIKKKTKNKISLLYRIKKINNNPLSKRYRLIIDKIYKIYLKKINKNLKMIILKIPNLTHHIIFNKNMIVKKKTFFKNINIIKEFNFNLNISNKTSGKGFCFINPPYSILYFALQKYMLDIHIKEHNYNYIIVPNILNFKSLINSGQIPKFIKKLYIIRNRDKIKYLIPTSEVSLVNFMRKKNVFSKFIPIKYISKTECYRNEKSYYGKLNKNIIKQKQFNKIELMQFVDNNNSYRYLKELLKNVEKIVKNLKINYRIVELSKKNLSYNSLKTFDIEIWVPSLNNYCEISSCSNLENYQSVRAGIKYIKKSKEKEYFSIINGSGVATGRLFLGILENYSTVNNKIKIPKTLKKYINKNFLKF